MSFCDAEAVSRDTEVDLETGNGLLSSGLLTGLPFSDPERPVVVQLARNRKTPARITVNTHFIKLSSVKGGGAVNRFHNKYIIKGTGGQQVEIKSASRIRKRKMLCNKLKIKELSNI